MSGNEFYVNYITRAYSALINSQIAGTQTKESALFDEEAEEGFWERRAKRHKKYLEQQQELDDKRKIMKRVYQEAAMRRGDYKDMFNGDGFVQMLNLANLLPVNEEK